ncbi:Nramp family divalent metal transporter [Halobaculum sp. EA56]|uniref:Nramp family divalent metal transporter n=1 Tax=Halobacteriales TaxID=2235 RepID=UPI003EBE77B5
MSRDRERTKREAETVSEDTVETNGPAPSDVYESRDEHRYPTSEYTPVAYDNLEVSPATDAHPDSGTGGRFRTLDLPKVPKLKYVVGPSAIMLGASLGSGETLFWPQLVARYGWSLYWLFLVGVLAQFVVNTEIQRWTLATGESVFRAMERLHPLVPFGFLLGGFASLGWPGWAASAAKVGAASLELGAIAFAGFELAGWRVLGIVLMVFVWLTYQLTPLMYNVVERLQILLVGLSIAFALVLFALIGSSAELARLPGELAEFGQQPRVGTIAILLGGLAFAGAGGYLNLSQSLWVREKGYGMGRYQGRIKNPFAGDDPETVHENGFSFPPTAVNLERWRGWWRVTQLEHLLTFVAGLVLATTALVAIAVTHAPGTTRTAVDMWLVDIAPSVGPVAAWVIYATLFLALFTTEYAIVESFVRNSSDIIYELYGRDIGWQLPELFWGLLTAFCAWGILILLLPVNIGAFSILVIGAAMSGLLMWPYIVVVQYINAVRLPEHVMPGWGRVIAMWFAAGFFGYFSVLLVGTFFSTNLGISVFAVEMAILGSSPGGYLLWAGYVVVQAFLVYRVTVAKLASEGTVADSEAGQGWFP